MHSLPQSIETSGRRSQGRRPFCLSDLSIMTFAETLGNPITITLDGAPIAKARARFGGGRVFTPEKTRDFQYSFGWTAKAVMANRKPFACAVKITALFELPISVSWSERKRADAITGTLKPSGKPDIDNLTKAVLDSCNAIVFTDDALIVELRATKRYGVNPKTVVTISPAAESSHE